MLWKVLALVLTLARSLPAQNISEQYLLAAANQDRAAQGVGQLRVDPALVLAAAEHAREMAKRGEISHQFSGEAGLAERVSRAGVRFSLVTENVAEAPNAALIHELWMHSPGHRRNLLDREVTSVGIAVVQDHGQLYAVEDFARTVEDVPLAAQERRVGSQIEAAGVPVGPATDDARRTCVLETGYAGLHRPGFVMRYTTNNLAMLPAELTKRLATGTYREAEVGACVTGKQGAFTSYTLAVMLFP